MRRDDSASPQSSWEHFYQLIHIQFPHCRVINIKIRGGMLLSYDRIQYSVIYTREAALDGRSAPEIWNEPWRRFWRFAHEIKDVDLPEVHFI